MILIENEDIAAYVRISVDLELKGENTSIENQKRIIESYVQQHFPGRKVDFFEDRDRSGYSFDEREGYQKMRKKLMNKEYGILIVKDLSRFSRRNSKGLVELEDLRDIGLRIIAIDDNVNFSAADGMDGWLNIQLRFLMNEIPVTDASKKVKSVVRNRQERGEWVCALPYGFRFINTKKMIFEAVPEEIMVIQEIFRLYLDEEWGYKKIAIYLTEKNYPTPRMNEKKRREEIGEDYRARSTGKWSAVTISTILKNDFYIGTLRQRKYERVKINGMDRKTDKSQELAIENHHPAIIDPARFQAAQEAHSRRTTSHYRGKKKNQNVYSGFLICGECGAHLSSLSRGDGDREAYHCATYSKLGKKHCTNHYVKAVQLDMFVRTYLTMLRDTSQDMIQRLQASIQDEPQQTSVQEDTLERLEKQLAEAEELLDALLLKQTKVEIQHGDNSPMAKSIERQIQAANKEILGIQNEIKLANDRRNGIIRVNRIAKLAIDIMEKMLQKERFDRTDLEFLFEKIVVHQDEETENGKSCNYKHFEIVLKPDIDCILRSGTLPHTMEEAANFNCGIVDSLNIRIVQKIPKHLDEVYDVNVVREGDPLEIYTEKDGGVIFRKYSPMGDLQDFASQMCEAIGSSTGRIAAVSDRDAIIALSGAPKRELLDKRNSEELGNLMEQRRNYRYESGEPRIQAAEGSDKYHLGVAAPILSQGDLMGCVMLLLGDGDMPLSEPDQKLAQTAATFLGKQMES